MRVWAVATALGLVAALIGWRAGNVSAGLSEGDVIAAYAARYVDETHGAGHTRDCAAVPGGRPDVWMVIVCDGSVARRIWAVGPRGAVVADGLTGS